MMARDEMRRLEVRQGEDWVEADQGQIEPGDVFRMFEPDGTPVADRQGRTAWAANAHPFISTDDTVEVLP